MNERTNLHAGIDVDDLTDVFHDEGALSNVLVGSQTPSLLFSLFTQDISMAVAKSGGRYRVSTNPEDLGGTVLIVLESLVLAVLSTRTRLGVALDRHEAECREEE